WEATNNVSNSDVFLYDIASGTKRGLSNTPDVWEQAADVAGETVVWDAIGSGGSELVEYDLTRNTATTFASAPSTLFQLGPAVISPSTDFIAYGQVPAGSSDSDIALYDNRLGGGLTLTTPGDGFADVFPQVSDNWVAWVRYPVAGAFVEDLMA